MSPQSSTLRFAGYAALFGKRDDGRDVIRKGAFVRTLHEQREPLPLFWQHRTDVRIGWVERIAEDERGLRVIASIDNPEGGAAAALKQGTANGLSFGYRARGYHRDAAGRELTDIDLYEVSLVSHPMQHAARVHMVEGGGERKANFRHYRENGQFARAGEGILYGSGASGTGTRTFSVSGRMLSTNSTNAKPTAPLKITVPEVDPKDEIVVIGDRKLQRLRDDFDATFPPKPAARPSPAAPSTHHELVRRFGSVIAIGEGNYESYNTGTQGVKDEKVGHSFVRSSAGAVTGKTINEILLTRGLSGYDRRRMFATGKYQTTIPTLAKAKLAMKLTGNELYTADLQERVFREYLIYKAGGGRLAAFVIDGKGSVDDAQYAAAQEWASIGVPVGREDQNGIVSNGFIRIGYRRNGLDEIV